METKITEITLEPYIRLGENDVILVTRHDNDKISIHTVGWSVSMTIEQGLILAEKLRWGGTPNDRK